MRPSKTITPLATPVLFMVFSRPETTQRVFDTIRSVRPTRLYIAADGPRENKPGEAEKCKQVRKIVSAVDWECEVHTLYRDENLGLGKALSGAITWFFEHETEGIILEDDCLPSPLFFTFCAELLAKYRDDTRVMSIGGNNFEAASLRDAEYSYRFSNLTYIWGWATWRRAWKLFDFQMNNFPEVNDKKYLAPSYNSIYERDYYQYVFGKMYKGDKRISSRTIWSYQWQFACKINSGLVIVPTCNLVINLGCGDQATNTHNPKQSGYDLVLETMEFPLHHPQFIMVDKCKDTYVFNMICTSASSRIRSQVKNILPTQMVEKFVRPLMSMFY